MATKKTIGDDARSKMGTPAFVSALLVGGIAVIVGAFFIGRSDTGQINVAATIQTSNEQGGGEAVGVVPEAFRNLPNGGLVPAENQETPPPAIPETVTDATTTATTTDEGTEEATDDATVDAAGGEGTELPADTATTPPTENATQ